MLSRCPIQDLDQKECNTAQFNSQPPLIVLVTGTVTVGDRITTNLLPLDSLRTSDKGELFST
jgi:hypothetical protein